MSKQIYFDAMKEKGKLDATDLQTRSAGMTGTELYAEDGKIPSFAAAVARKNMLERKPEDLPAQWGFQWSTDPKKALPFIALSTSPYAKDDCCTHDGHVWRSGQDNNVWAPGTAGAKWNDLGEIEEVMEAG